MILELDMGNTRIKWRLRRDSANVARGSMNNNEELDVLTQALNPHQSQSVTNVFVASVVDANRNQALIKWAQNLFGITPVFARSQSRLLGVENGYYEPERLGIDRWLAILAGYQRARGACVVIDCGSAITLDLVSASGRHCGGYIAPGFEMMRQVLAQNTHAIDMADNVSVLNMAPGRDTQSAIAAAQAAMVTGLVERAIEQLRLVEPGVMHPTIFITGGDTNLLVSTFPNAIVVPDLVFEGLGLTFSTN